ASGELDHVFSRCGNIVIIDRRSDQYSIGAFDCSAESLRTWHPVTFIRITERQIHLADIDPIAIDFLFLQMHECGAPHPAAVAGRVAAGADHKMLRHWFAGESLRKAGMQGLRRNRLASRCSWFP